MHVAGKKSTGICKHDESPVLLKAALASSNTMDTYQDKLKAYPKTVLGNDHALEESLNRIGLPIAVVPPPWNIHVW